MSERMSDEEFERREPNNMAALGLVTEGVYAILYAEIAALRAALKKAEEENERLRRENAEAKKLHRADNRLIEKSLALDDTRKMRQLWDKIEGERDAAEAALKKAEEERDEARDWVRKMHREAQVLTCVYCGHAYPPGTPASGSDALTAHIKTCEKHPLRAAEARADVAEGEVERLKFEKDYTLTKMCEARDAVLARAVAAEAHARELYEESLDAARQSKTEIDAVTEQRDVIHASLLSAVAATDAAEAKLKEAEVERDALHTAACEALASGEFVQHITGKLLAAEAKIKEVEEERDDIEIKRRYLEGGIKALEARIETFEKGASHETP